MNADPPPESEEGTSGTPALGQPFAGTLDAGSLTSTVRKTPLTDDERAHPLALAPLAQFLAGRKPALAAGLEEVASAVRSESWGLGPAPPLAARTPPSSTCTTPPARPSCG
jgi:hypothetical protein